MNYSIPSCNMAVLTKKLTRIENKCNKYGCQFLFSIVGEHYENIFEDGHPVGTARYIDIEVSGKAIINDWEFVATLEHTPEGNIVRKFDDQPTPDWARTVEAKCDHCKTKHRRKDTYLIKNTVTGEFKQVGKSCLKDFTNGLSAEQVSSYMSYFETLESSYEPYSGKHTYLFSTKTYLMFAAECIKHFGFTSKANANEYSVATACRAASYMVTPDRYALEEMEQVGFKAETEDNRLSVEAALIWVMDQNDTSDYISNLKLSCKKEYCKPRDFGILASLLPAHFKAIEKEEARIARESTKVNKPVSSWVGEIGDRVELTAECKYVTCWETDFGVTRLYRFTTAEGNVLMWKTGKGIDDGQVTLKGTIKSHTEFNGDKQTELTRCKVL